MDRVVIIKPINICTLLVKSNKCSDIKNAIRLIHLGKLRINGCVIKCENYIFTNDKEVEFDNEKFEVQYWRQQKNKNKGDF